MAIRSTFSWIMDNSYVFTQTIKAKNMSLHLTVGLFMYYFNTQIFFAALQFTFCKCKHQKISHVLRKPVYNICEQ